MFYFGSVFVLRLLVLVLLFPSTVVFAQQPWIKFDDFNKRHGWWTFHRDGTVAADPSALELGKGYLKLQLSNPDSVQECNVAISEVDNVYDKSIKLLGVETRIKLLTPMQPGSRGWGLWKSNVPGALQSLAWFMEQWTPKRPELSWQLAGVVDKKKRKAIPWQPEVNKWHVYRIERDLPARNVRFWVDDQLILNAKGIVPRGRLSFHVWIDNQVYAPNVLIREHWEGTSALLVDYVKVYSKPKVYNAPSVKHPAILFYKKWNDVLNGIDEYTVEQFKIQSRGGKVFIVVTARLEDYGQYGSPDVLTLYLDNQAEPIARWTGKQTHGQTQTFFVELPLDSGPHRFTLKAQNTPVLHDFLVVNGNSQIGRPVYCIQNFSSEVKHTKTIETKLIQSPTKQALVLGYLAVTVNEAAQFDQIRPINRLETADQHLLLTVQENKGKILKQIEFCGNQYLGECATHLWLMSSQTPKIQIKLQPQNQPTVHRLIFFQLSE